MNATETIYAVVGRGGKAHIVDVRFGNTVLCGAESNGRGITVRSALRKVINVTENQICKSCRKIGA